MSRPGFRLPRAPLAYAPEVHGAFPLAERPMQFSAAISVAAHVALILLPTFIPQISLCGALIYLVACRVTITRRISMAHE